MAFPSSLPEKSMKKPPAEKIIPYFGLRLSDKEGWQLDGLIGNPKKFGYNEARWVDDEPIAGGRL